MIVHKRNRKIKTNLIIGLIGAAQFVLCSCAKLIEVDPPRNQLVTETAFDNDETAVSALNGLYVRMSQNFTSISGSAMTIYPGMSADELVNVVLPSDDAFSKNNLTADNTVLFNSLWNPAYNFIYHANLIMENVKENTRISEPVKKQLEGESLAIRAYFHLQLAELFDRIPLILSTDYQANTGLPQSGREEVFDQVIEDLIRASQLLSDEDTSGNKTRLNRLSVLALLARVYLETGQYNEAFESSDEVIRSGSYRLESDLDQVFLSSSPEIIWQLMPVMPNFNSPEGSSFVPSNATSLPVYALNQDLLDQFSQADARLSAWVGHADVNGNSYYFPFKYKVKMGTPVTEYNVILRLAEQHLIRAEAAYQLGRDVQAADDLQTIRERALLFEPAIGQDSLLDAIMAERRRELFCERGIRWSDLNRTKSADEVLGSLKGETWQPTDINYPIPASELLKNPALTQNEGY